MLNSETGRNTHSQKGLSHERDTHGRHTRPRSRTHSLVLVNIPLGAPLRVASSSFLRPSLSWILLSPGLLRPWVRQWPVLCPSLHPRSRGRPCNRGCPGPAPAQFLHPSPPPLGPPCWSRPGASSTRPPPHWWARTGRWARRRQSTRAR